MNATPVKSKRLVDLTGRRFGPLEVVRLHGTDGHKALWTVQCQCGNITVKVGTEISKKRRVPVGCSKQCPLARAAISESNRTHGMSKHPAHAVWSSMTQRCINPRHAAYHNYGGRGIGVCDEWLDDFSQFWADMGPTYQRGLDIDRRDNNSGYCKENCRWVTRTVNSRNTRRSRIAGEIIDRCRQNGIGISTLGWRIRNGVKPEAACERIPDLRNRFTTSETVGREGGLPSEELKGFWS